MNSNNAAAPDEDALDLKASPYYDVYLTAEQCKRLKPHPLAAKGPPMSAKQYAALSDDVAVVGVQRPITIDMDKRFAMEGIHRARAGAETGKGAPAMYYNPERDGNVRDFVRRANLTRRHQGPSSLAWTYAKLYEGKLGDNQHTKGEPVQVCTGSLPVSLRSVRAGVCARDRGGPELHLALDADELPVSLAERLVKEWPVSADQDAVLREARGSDSAKSFAIKVQKVMQTWRNRERVKHNRAIDPDGEQLDIWYADPPWTFPGDEEESGHPWSVSAHYPPMPTEKICEYLPIARVPKDAALFLWSTEFHLFRGDARQVMEAWGFRYYSTIIWDKEIIGFGNVIRHRHEPLIVGVKGKLILTRPKEVITSIYSEKRTRKHSEKPKLYGLIDSIVPPAARRAELFNRGGAPAPWIAFGNESGSVQ